MAVGVGRSKGFSEKIFQDIAPTVFQATPCETELVVLRPHIRMIRVDQIV